MDIDISLKVIATDIIAPSEEIKPHKAVHWLNQFIKH